MDGVANFVRALGPSRIAAMGAVAVGLLGFFVFLMVRFSQPHMTVLFTELAFDDSVAIVKKLESLNIPHELRQDGAVVLVPKEAVLRTRMQLAEDGLPAGGTVGYEIFDKGDTLGATSFVQNINQLRALEGELARTIRSIKRVKFARVHLVLPKRQLFSREKVEPSAAIILNVHGSLDASQVRAIQHLAASAVLGLKVSRISIVDQRGKLLASGQGDGADDMLASAAEDRNRAFETRMQRQIEEIIGSVVGDGHVRVRVTASLDYTHTNRSSEVFDPDGQVVRSTVSRNEDNTSSQAGSDGSVSVSNELPSADGEGGGNSGIKDRASKSEETVNYEISKTRKTEVTAAGRVKNISVAVLVDGVYKKDQGGTVVYAPRAQDELQEITKLVQSAIGFDKERGDQVHISNLRFADRPTPNIEEKTEESLLDFSKDDYFYMAELAVTLIVSLLVLLFIVRPLVRRILLAEEDAMNPLVPQIAIDPATGLAMVQIAVPEGAAGMSAADQLALRGPNKAQEMLEIAKVSGEVQASAIKEVGEIIAGHPQDAVAVIRDWMEADAA